MHLRSLSILQEFHHLQRAGAVFPVLKTLVLDDIPIYNHGELKKLMPQLVSLTFQCCS
eukprot:TRINITY_DN16515_c0_g1_i1.p1 TRINITY_DN16515_c0_g1~~TRINITY_DN16515_c0_g1_i1.p1  ORF type:complete len:58 (-),score=4.50 TRINITY_DN16515_c0_g1_i1:50-223(-)